MSKSIKVSDEVYKTIQKYQAPRESYSSVIRRAFAGLEALADAQTIFRDMPHLPGGVKREVGP